MPNACFVDNRGYESSRNATLPPTIVATNPPRQYVLRRTALRGPWTRTPRIDAPRFVAKHHHVADLPGRNDAAGDVENARRRASTASRRSAEREILESRTPAHRRRFPDPVNPTAACSKSVDFFGIGMRRVIAGASVDASVAHAGAKRRYVVRGTQRRIDFRRRHPSVATSSSVKTR